MFAVSLPLDLGKERDPLFDQTRLSFTQGFGWKFVEMWKTWKIYGNEDKQFLIKKSSGKFKSITDIFTISQLFFLN